MEEKCIYCGKPTGKTKWTVRLGKDGKQCYCCSTECYQKVMRFIERSPWRHIPIYILGAILIGINLIFLGIRASGWWTFIPMSGLGLLVALDPSIFATNYMYETLGIVRLEKTIRAVGIAVMVFGLFTVMFYRR